MFQMVIHAYKPMICGILCGLRFASQLMYDSKDFGGQLFEDSIPDASYPSKSLMSPIPAVKRLTVQHRRKLMF